MFEIRKLKSQDAELFSEIAPKIYLEFFEYLWQDKGQSYTEKSFALIDFRKKIEDEENLYFGAFSGGEMIGFLKIIPNETLPVFVGKNAFNIEKIYVSKSFHGKGLGKKLMDLAFEIAEKTHKEIVWLDVVAGNEKAIGFYENLVFEKCGKSSIDFPTVKPEFSELIVMKKAIGDFK